MTGRRTRHLQQAGALLQAQITKTVANQQLSQKLHHLIHRQVLMLNQLVPIQSMKLRLI